MACCEHPNGKAGICISAYVVSVLAFTVGMFTLGWFIGQVFGLVAMILLLCTACTRMSKCGLITAAIFAFFGALGQIGFAISFGLICSSSDSYYGSYYYDDDFEIAWIGCSSTHAIVIALCSIAAILYIAAGVLALFIPVPPPEGSTKNPPSGSNTQTPATADPTTFDSVHPEDEVVNAPAKILSSASAEWEDDVSRRTRILSERQSLRDQGVPQEEIDLVFPLPKEDV